MNPVVIDREDYERLIQANQDVNESLEQLINEHAMLQEMYHSLNTKYSVVNARVQNTAALEEELFNEHTDHEVTKKRLMEVIILYKHLEFNFNLLYNTALSALEEEKKDGTDDND